MPITKNIGLQNTGQGPTVSELRAFIAELEASGVNDDTVIHLAVDPGDQRDPQSWSMQTTSVPSAQGIRLKTPTYPQGARGSMVPGR